MTRLRQVVAAVLLAHVAVTTAAWAKPSATRDIPPDVLAVPFLPQSEELCGGAAAAMVFRYWGDRHAAVEQFEPLVDRKAGGITGGVLVDAITARGWTALRRPGSIDDLREQIALGRPVIILLEDRPRTYHYLVVIGADADGVVVHDPSWGPSRRIGSKKLIRIWQPSGFWSLVVLPATSSTPPYAHVPREASVPRTSAPVRPRTPCEARLDDAVALIRSRGLGAADAAIAQVREDCPDAAAPIRELAGVRFAERRWRDAEALAAEAVARDSDDRYAWEVLAASRFVQNDLRGSLAAWNQVGKPRIDLVNIAGLQHARHAVIARVLDLPPNALLTADRFGRASRRLGDLPDRVSSRITYRPAPDGFAEVDVVIAERPWMPRGSLGWSAAGVKALVSREVEIKVPGFTGLGDTWTIGWRWWENRPRIAVSFATPRSGWWPGVLRVDLSVESQRYQFDPSTMPDGQPARVTETRTHGAVSIGDWLTPSLRYRATAEVDEWTANRRTVGIGAEVERRSPADRLSLTAAVGSYVALGTARAFQAGSIRAFATTSADPHGWVLSARAGAAAVTDAAPFGVWPGAGTGHARTPLLRAHPLLDDGVITGPAFGRRLMHAGIELERWIDRGSPLRVAIAGFADMTLASRRLTVAAGAPGQVDLGLGVRIRLPTAGTLRADLGRGLRDGATALSIGWIK